jgi:hypothetical protein
MAGFEVITYGRFWPITEEGSRIGAAGAGRHGEMIIIICPQCSIQFWVKKLRLRPH